jgi:uncharacterized membrane protein YqhA
MIILKTVKKIIIQTDINQSDTITMDAFNGTDTKLITNVLFLFSLYLYQLHIIKF